MYDLEVCRFYQLLVNFCLISIFIIIELLLEPLLLRIGYTILRAALESEIFRVKWLFLRCIRELFSHFIVICFDFDLFLCLRSLLES